MDSRLRRFAYIAVGMFGSAALFVFGAVLFTLNRSRSLLFWVFAIGLLAVLWMVILSPLGAEIGPWKGSPAGLRALTAASAFSGVVFLALWAFIIFFSGGRASLFVVVAYAAASGVLLLLVSLPNLWTAGSYKVRMPILAGGVFATICLGFIFLTGASL